MTKKTILLLLLTFFAAGCAAPATAPSVTATATRTPEITPSATLVRAAIPSNTPRAVQPTPIRITVTPTPAFEPSPSPTPTVEPVPTTSAAPATSPNPPVIQTFQARPESSAPGDPTDPGGTVILTWSASNADKAIIYQLLPSGQLPADGWDVPTSGTLTHTLAAEVQNRVDFVLYVWDAQGRSANAGAEVAIRCRYTWFFEPAPESICPTKSLTSPAAVQTFERGTMLWLGTEDAIVVLYTEPAYTTRWARFEDRWDEGNPVDNPALEPPPGLQQPIRGFGLVWREHPEVREQLGWATAGEQGYTTVLQRTTRYKYNAAYVLARDGDVWYLGPERSAWDKLTPAALTLDPRK